MDSVPWGHEAQVSQVLVSRGGLGFGTTALKRNFFDDSCVDSVLPLGYEASKFCPTGTAAAWLSATQVRIDVPRKAPDLLNWAAVHGKLYYEQTLRLSLVDLRWISCVIFAELC